MIEENGIIGFPYLNPDVIKNEGFSEALNTRVQPTLYNHIGNNLGFFGLKSIQEFTRILIVDFFAGNIVKNISNSDIVKKNAMLESLCSDLVSKNKSLQERVISLESERNQMESTQNHSVIQKESNLILSESEQNQMESTQNLGGIKKESNWISSESEQNQMESTQNLGGIRNESNWNQTESEQNQVESPQNLNGIQMESQLEQENISLKERLEISKSNISLLNKALKDAAKFTQVPEGYQVLSPKELAELESNYKTAISKAKILSQENQDLKDKLGKMVNFDDSHTAVALRKLAKDIAFASRVPFYRFDEEGVMKLFLKYYQIEIDNAISPAK